VQDFIDQESYDLIRTLDKKACYYTLDDKLWAMPFGMIVPLLYYRQDPSAKVGPRREKPRRTRRSIRRPRKSWS